MVLYGNFDYTLNFWEVNPHYKPLFKDFHTKPDSSIILWAIAYLHHPKSPFYNLLYSEREEEILKDLTLPSNFKFSNYEDIATQFTRTTLTYAEKALTHWRKELEERTNYLSSIAYSPDTPMDLIEFKERLIKNTSSIWDQYRKAEKELKEETEIKSVGDSQPSLQDQNLI